MINNIRFN